MLYDESITNQKSRKLSIFLFFIFIFVSSLIFVWGYRYYKDAVDMTDESVETTSCWAYSYSVQNIDYKDNILSFQIHNRRYSDGRISKATIITQKETREIEFTQVSQGITREIKIEDIEIDQKFYLYIENCRDLIKEYSI